MTELPLEGVIYKECLKITNRKSAEKEATELSQFSHTNAKGQNT